MEFFITTRADALSVCNVYPSARFVNLRKQRRLHEDLMGGVSWCGEVTLETVFLVCIMQEIVSSSVYLLLFNILLRLLSRLSISKRSHNVSRLWIYCSKFISPPEKWDFTDFDSVLFVCEAAVISIHVPYMKHNKPTFPRDCKKITCPSGVEQQAKQKDFHEFNLAGITHAETTKSKLEQHARNSRGQKFVKFPVKIRKVVYNN